MSLTLDELYNQSAILFNALFPVVGLAGGLMISFAVLNFVMRAVKGGDIYSAVPTEPAWKQVKMAERLWPAEEPEPEPTPTPPPDWWRCDGCGHANPFKVKGEWNLSCDHCGAQMPTRYDP